MTSGSTLQVYDSFVINKETTDDWQKGHSFHANFLQWPRGSPTFFSCELSVQPTLWLSHGRIICCVHCLFVEHYTTSPCFKNHKNTQNSNFGVGLVSLSVLAVLCLLYCSCADVLPERLLSKCLPKRLALKLLSIHVDEDLTLTPTRWHFKDDSLLHLLFH